MAPVARQVLLKSFKNVASSLSSTIKRIVPSSASHTVSQYDPAMAQERCASTEPARLREGASTPACSSASRAFSVQLLARADNGDGAQSKWGHLGLAASAALVAAAAAVGDNSVAASEPDVDNRNKQDRPGRSSSVEHVIAGLQQRFSSFEASGVNLSLPRVEASGTTVVVHCTTPDADPGNLMVEIACALGAQTFLGAENPTKISYKAWRSPLGSHMAVMYVASDMATKAASQEAAGSNDGLQVIFTWDQDGSSVAVKFVKPGTLSDREMDAIVACIHEGALQKSNRAPAARERGVLGRSGSGVLSVESHPLPLPMEDGGERGAVTPGGDGAVAARRAEAKRLEGKLEGMGVKVYGLDKIGARQEEGSGNDSNRTEDVWDGFAGYEEQKRIIEDTVLLALKRPEVYDSIAQGTRRHFESNRPRALLFDGPPGTGKTSCARVIAEHAGVALLYVPLDAIASKYYGESEKTLARIFELGQKFPGGAIVFLDEVDALATTREQPMHEATRRVLAVLLRQMDGFDRSSRVVVIAATNRKQDLDPALLSRFDASVTFDLPDEETRGKIMAQFARHLSKEDLARLAESASGMSGRDIRDVCEQTERHWASKVIRSQGKEVLASGLPPIEEYLESTNRRQKAMTSHIERPSSHPPPQERRWRMA